MPGTRAGKVKKENPFVPKTSAFLTGVLLIACNVPKGSATHAQCQPTLATGPNDVDDAGGNGEHVEQAGGDGAKRTRTPSKTGSPNKDRRKKQQQSFLNLDIYDELDKEVEEASKAFILPTENSSNPPPSLNVKDPPQQNPLMGLPVRGSA